MDKTCSDINEKEAVAARSSDSEVYSDDALIVSTPILSAPVLSAPGPSKIASRVQSLKASAFNAAAKRSNLPRTLFWSLLRVEVDEIKKKKAKQRMMRIIS